MNLKNTFTAAALTMSLGCSDGKVDSYAHKNISIVPGGNVTLAEAQEAQKSLDCLYNEFRSTPYIENSEERNNVIDNIKYTRNELLKQNNISSNTITWWLKRESLGNGAFKTYSTNIIDKAACDRSINCKVVDRKPVQLSNEACEQYAVK